PFIVDSRLVERSFRKEAGKADKQLLVFEGGEAARLDSFAIEEGVRGVLRLMKFLGMSKEIVPDNETKIINSSSWIRAKYSGLFHTEMQAGQKVEKGQVLGLITDPFGEFEHKIKAPNTGYIIGVNHLTVVNAGGAIIHLGKSI